MSLWDERKEEREQMVREQVEARGIADGRVLDALRRLPRHRFIPPSVPGISWNPVEFAYNDGAQAIGEGQTISQPYIVALMSEALHLTGSETVLEIGAGSGYQSAVLSLLAGRVIAIERHLALAQRARQVLDELGIANVDLRVGDGSHGLPEFAPYDAILAAAVAPSLPPAWVAQVKTSGRIVLPVGAEDGDQYLHVYRKSADGAAHLERDLGIVRFVPLVGAYGFGLPDDLGGMDI